MSQRKEFSVSVKRQIYERAGGVCETPSCENSGLEYDHIKECWEGGRATFDNCKLLCPKCHKAKSAHSTSLRAKGKRFKVVKARPKSGKIKSPGFQRNGSKLQSANRWPKGRKIQSRRF